VQRVKVKILTLAAILSVACLAVHAAATTASTEDARAKQILRQMTLEEKLALIRGKQPFQLPPTERPPQLVLGAGYVAGIPRLGIPYLAESDASLGVANQGGMMRSKDVATALPSGAAMAATWDAGLVERGGAAIGAEARSKGFNVLLAGGMNLVREPRCGRNFEYLGEDPLLAGTLGGHAIRGIQSNHIVSTIKHYALNSQETGRAVASAHIGEAAMRESDLLAFEIGIEIGNPGSIMCSYNRVNGIYTCENEFLLNQVLRRDWGYKGWVMSDWGAVHSTSIQAGLDQESGTSTQDKGYFGSMLREGLAAGRIAEADVDRSVLRILRSMYAQGVTADPVNSEATIDYASHAAIAQELAEEGIVLLKNTRELLPVTKTPQRILVVGGHADVGVLQGGGSSQVNPVGGAALSIPSPGEPIYHRKLYSPSAPLEALRQMLPAADITFDDGSDVKRAAAAAHDAGLVLVFAEQFTQEGRDVPTLSLPDGQDELIDAIGSSNPRTVVVLETGGPVLMPWLDKVGAVLAAWYPGQRGGLAITRIVTGAVNPSGRLPITFPRSIDQIPHPQLPGGRLIKSEDGREIYDQDLKPFDIDYTEGADVGYRWYDHNKQTALFAFGYGLTYTRFEYRNLSIKGGANLRVSFQLKNAGARAGAEVAQVYAQVEAVRRLVGWTRVTLQPGEAQEVTVTADPRLLAAFDTRANAWRINPGSYAIEVSTAVNEPRLTGSARLSQRLIKP
jgi:beta-glucosidase